MAASGKDRGSTDDSEKLCWGQEKGHIHLILKQSNNNSTQLTNRCEISCHVSPNTWKINTKYLNNQVSESI